MSKPQRKRAPRVSNYSLKDFVLLREDGLSFHLHNVSETGLAVLRRPGDSWGGKGMLYKGILRNEKNKSLQFPMYVKVERVAETFVGLSYQNVAPDWIQFLRQTYDIELDARETVSVSSSVLQKPGEGTPYWFFDGLSSELYYVVAEQKIIQLRINHRNLSVEYQAGGKPSFYVGEQPEENIPQAIETFKRFLFNVEELSKPHRSMIVDLLSNAI